MLYPRSISFVSLAFLVVTAGWGQVGQVFVSSTLAGSNPLGDGGPATNARLWGPEDMAADGQGNIYFTDARQGLVRKFSLNGNISTIAGGGRTLPSVGMNVQALQVALVTPSGIAVDGKAGMLYVSDPGAQVIYSINLQSGFATLLAGQPFISGTNGDNGPAAQAYLNDPRGMALDATGGLLFADRGNNRIRRILVNTGTILSFAGTGARGYSGDGAAADKAFLDGPTSVAVGPDGTIYISDYNNYRIRRVKNGTIDRFAGNGSPRYSGDNGVATEAGIDGRDVAVDADGNVYICDTLFYRIRKVDPTGRITSIAGSTVRDFTGDGGNAQQATFDNPRGVATDGAGGLLIADRGNFRIRRITLTSNAITTVAGRSRFGGEGASGADVLMSQPYGVAVDPQGGIVFSDTENHCVRRIGTDGKVVTIAGTPGRRGKGAENVAATSTTLDQPLGLAIDSDGTIYVADWGNRRVRRIAPNGLIRTITGDGPFDLYGANSIALDRRAKRLYFTDDTFNQIVVVDLTPAVPALDLYAGSIDFVPGYNGDGRSSIGALISSPAGIALHPEGGVVFADLGNARVRRINASGVISTVAGTGSLSLTSGDGPASSVAVNLPIGVAFDGDATLYFTETYGRIRRVVNGRVETIAGQSSLSIGFAGDGATGAAVLTSSPSGMAFLANGSLVYADSGNQRIRQLAPQAALVASKLELVAGDRQTGEVSKPAALPLQVRVRTATDILVSGVTVNFAVTRGAATVSSATAVTGADGIASVNVVFGATAGAVQVTATTGTLTPIVFNLTANPAAPVVPRPAIAAGGVVGVGNSVPSVRSLSPGGLITVYGSNFLAAGTAGRNVAGEEIVNGQLPTSLLGVCVEVSGVRAYLVGVYPNQINAQLPAVQGTTAPVRVKTSCGTAAELTSDVENVPVAAAAPEFLYAQLSADGTNPVIAVNAVTGALVGPSTIPGFSEAQAGDVLTLYATGFGLTNPVVAPGSVPTGVASVPGAVRVTIGGVELAAGDVLYAGVAPGLVINQLNIRVPAGLPPGNLPFRIFIGGIGSPERAYLAVK